MRRGYLETVLPRKNAGMDGTDCHVPTDRQVYAILFAIKNNTTIIDAERKNIFES